MAAVIVVELQVYTAVAAHAATHAARLRRLARAVLAGRSITGVSAGPAVLWIHRRVGALAVTEDKIIGAALTKGSTLAVRIVAVDQLVAIFIESAVASLGVACPTGRVIAAVRVRAVGGTIAIIVRGIDAAPGFGREALRAA